jgi:hypothetical protein
MISIEEEKKILELAKLIPEKKITQAKISRIMDISVQTVAAIIHYGKIREMRYQKKREINLRLKEKSLAQKKHKKIIYKPDIPPAPEIFQVGPDDYTRCRSCGRLVIQPCFACWLESHRNR